MSPLLKHLATKFADRQAIDTILDQCGVQVLDGVTWRDTQVVKNVQNVVWEVKYLSLRGLLVHHPLVHNLVRVRGHEKTT